MELPANSERVMGGKRSVLCSVFCVLTGGEEKGQGMANSLIFLTPTHPKGRI